MQVVGSTEAGSWSRGAPTLASSFPRPAAKADPSLVSPAPSAHPQESLASSFLVFVPAVPAPWNTLSGTFSRAGGLALCFP